MYFILLYSLIAGILGTGLGAVIGIFFDKRSEKSIGLLLSFAGGVMLAIVFFDLIPEALDLKNNILFVIFAIVCGASLVVVVDLVIDYVNKLNEKKTIEEQSQTAKKNRLLRSGCLLLIAVILHNLPEGLAIGTAGIYSHNMGLTLAILIGIHNIPEGAAMILPLINGGMSKPKSMLLTILAASTLVIGTALGIIIGTINEAVIAFFLGVAGGAMLFVTFAEILPTAFSGKKRKISTLIMLAGILLGFVLVNLLHI